MARKITQRELRNESGKIMRALDRGETFVVTRNGVPVGELTPLRQRQFITAETAAAVFRGAPSVELNRFRQDVDTWLDQEPAPARHTSADITSGPTDATAAAAEGPILRAQSTNRSGVHSR